MMEGKALRGWSRRQEGNFCDLLESIGNGADQRLGGDSLNASDSTFDRGLELARGRREPDANEAGPLAKFNRRGGAPRRT
jgi:hypothetical protein